MKKVNILRLFFVIALTTGMSVQATDLKIGFVNLATVEEQSPQKKQALARLEKEFSSRNALLQKKIKTLRTKQEQLSKDRAILSQDELKTKERKLLSEQREFKRLQEEYDEDFSIRRNEELRRLIKEITKTIVDLAKKEAYDLVVYQGVIHASERADMTQQVLEILKSKVK